MTLQLVHSTGPTMRWYLQGGYARVCCGSPQVKSIDRSHYGVVFAKWFMSGCAVVARRQQGGWEHRHVTVGLPSIESGLAGNPDLMVSMSVGPECCYPVYIVLPNS